MHESLRESVFFKNSQTALCGEDGREQGLALQTRTWQGRGTDVRGTLLCLPCRLAFPWWVHRVAAPTWTVKGSIGVGARVWPTFRTSHPSAGTTGRAGSPVEAGAEGRKAALHSFGSSLVSGLERRSLTLVAREDSRGGPQHSDPLTALLVSHTISDGELTPSPASLAAEQSPRMALLLPRAPPITLGVSISSCGFERDTNICSP